MDSTTDKLLGGNFLCFFETVVIIKLDKGVLPWTRTHS